MNRIEPYSDDKLTYENGMYCLTLQYVKDRFNATGKFRDDGVLLARIEKNSEKIYDVIYDRSNQRNKKIVDFVLNETQEGREWLLRLLKTEMEADLDYAYNSLGDLPAVNGANGQVIDRNELFRNEISVATERVLDNSTRYLGFNIMVAYPISGIF